MNLFEIAGFMNGKCLPGDIKIGENLAEYISRKFTELEEKLEEAERYGRQADITIDNLEARCAALAAENARCKFEVSRCHQTVDEMFNNRDKWVDKEWLSSIWSTSKRLMDETPATDAFLAEVRAQGADAVAAYHAEREEAISEIAPFASRDHKNARIHAMDIAAQLRQEAK